MKTQNDRFQNQPAYRIGTSDLKEGRSLSPSSSVAGVGNGN